MYHIAAFYRFASITDPERVREIALESALANELSGTVLVAKEGVNGTVAASSPERVERTLDAIRACAPDLADLCAKWSTAAEPPFARMRVSIKDEIVALGLPDVDPTDTVGTYVAPAHWDRLVERDDVVLIDCRNHYEIEVGTFSGAIDPGTLTFKEFVDWAEDHLASDSTPRVAMFCTGGIRCEKATSLLLERGIPEVYHLEGGILRYLEERGSESETWQGECFVFDRRVSVDRHLRPSANWDICGGCGHPVDGEHRAHPDFEEGVSCRRCRDRWTDAVLERRRARRREQARQA